MSGDTCAQRNGVAVLELLRSDPLINVCAPMVRYSKLAFRKLVRKYNCDICYTPMIIADSFVQSAKARDNEFTTCADDRPLVVQFAANKSSDFVRATEMVLPFCDGVDLNCGCPQRWAAHQGYGACLMHEPDLVSDIIRQTRNFVSDSRFTVSVKTRIHPDLRKTVDFCRQLESAGVSYIAVHGRTKDQRSEPVNLEAIRLVRESVTIPVIANGDITTLEGAVKVQQATGVHGVMSARGLLHDPALFAGNSHTPLECVEDWVRISLETGTPFITFHQHLIYMMEKCTSRADRRLFNILTSTTGVIEFLRKNYGLVF